MYLVKYVWEKEDGSRRGGGSLIVDRKFLEPYFRRYNRNVTGFEGKLEELLATDYGRKPAEMDEGYDLRLDLVKQYRKTGKRMDDKVIYDALDDSIWGYIG